MGRKGDSKRKPSKSKNPVIANKSGNGAVSSIPTPLVKEEALSTGKGGSKNSFGSQQKDKKR